MNKSTVVIDLTKDETDALYPLDLTLPKTNITPNSLRDEATLSKISRNASSRDTVDFMMPKSKKCLPSHNMLKNAGPTRLSTFQKSHSVWSNRKQFPRTVVSSSTKLSKGKYNFSGSESFLNVSSRQKHTPRAESITFSEFERELSRKITSKGYTTHLVVDILYRIPFELYVDMISAKKTQSGCLYRSP